MKSKLIINDIQQLVKQKQGEYRTDTEQCMIDKDEKKMAANSDESQLIKAKKWIRVER